MKHEGSPSGTPEEEQLLARYTDLLLRYAIPRGLISANDASDLRRRHVADGVRARGLVPRSGRAVDMGSGAGLPGVPLAIVTPGLQVVLAESRRTRIAFLELAIEELGLPNASVHAGRVQELPPTFEVALARGFGDAAATWDAARAVLADAGRLLYWAGASFEVTRDAPTDAHVALHASPGLESQGPIAIMTRQ